MNRSQGIVEINGANLYYEEAGAGHPLVLIHGGLVDSRLWDSQMGPLSQLYRVIRYDLRWFGRSGATEGEYSNVEDLSGLLTHMAIERTYVLGLSLGGAVALDFTLINPEKVDALILVGSAISGDTRVISDDIQSLYAQFLKAFDERDLPRAVEVSLQMFTDGPNRSAQDVTRAVREQIRSMSEQNLEAQARLQSERELPDAISRLHEIRVPTLVVVGELDSLGIRANQDTLAEAIPGAEKVVVPGTGHHLNMERPEEFNAIVSNFLARLHQR